MHMHAHTHAHARTHTHTHTHTHTRTCTAARTANPLSQSRGGWGGAEDVAAVCAARGGAYPAGPHPYSSIPLGLPF